MKFFVILICLTIATSAYEITETNTRNSKQVEIKGVGVTPVQPAPYDKWHVHDPKRTQPPVTSPKYNGEPVLAPKAANVIFDGTDLKRFVNKKWPIMDKAMVVYSRFGGQKTIQEFGDIHLHVEWKSPVRDGWGQAQGNSGIFLMGRYEVQVLNCWANRTYPDGMTGAIYGQRPPAFNACKKPGEWQVYDIHFKAPVFKDKKLVSPAYITVIFNGITIHDNYELTGITDFKKVASYRPHAAQGPITFQAHGSKVSYRNIWTCPLKLKLGK